MKVLTVIAAAACAVGCDALIAAPSREKLALKRRGGVIAPAASCCLPALKTALTAGPYGVPALAAVATATLTPLTMYRQGYSFSVGYGSAVAAVAAVLLHEFGSKGVGGSLAVATLFYGLRLASHLLARQLTVPTMAKRIEAFDKTPRLKRFPLILSVGIFYGMMCSPLLYALRSPAVGVVPVRIAKFGLGLAWTGAVVEAVADTQKFILKRMESSKRTVFFQGPTGGLYAKCRHPNYLGEVMFWLGLLVTGAPSFLAVKSPTPWITGILGFFGIFSIMRSATARLDKNQLEKHGGEPDYDAWRANTGALLPKLL